MINDNETLSLILKLMRDGKALARSDLQRLTGLGRGLLAERVGQLMRAKIVVEGDLGASTGGRAARELRLNNDAGVILVAQGDLRRVALGLADLNGRVIASSVESWEFGAGPEAAFEHVSKGWRSLLLQEGVGEKPVWAMGVGLPAHVDFDLGTLIDSPSLPSVWKTQDFRQALVRDFSAPAWIDTSDNLVALGEMREGTARAHRTFIYVDADIAIGSGLVVEGRPFRGHQGAAGNIGHIRSYGSDDALCRCGRRGCLEAVASGEALVRRATREGETGRSAFFANLLLSQDRLSVADIAKGANEGDRQALGLLTEAGHRIGETLASVVNVINPSLIIIGGCLPATGELLMAAIKEALFKQSLPFVTRDLQVVQALNRKTMGLIGAAHLVIDRIFRPDAISDWLERGTPAFGRLDDGRSGDQTV